MNFSCCPEEWRREGKPHACKLVEEVGRELQRKRAREPKGLEKAYFGCVQHLKETGWKRESSDSKTRRPERSSGLDQLELGTWGGNVHNLIKGTIILPISFFMT